MFSGLYTLSASIFHIKRLRKHSIKRKEEIIKKKTDKMKEEKGGAKGWR